MDSIGTSYKLRAIAVNDSVSDSFDDSDEDSDFESSRISSRTECESIFCDSEAEEYDDYEEDFDSNIASNKVNNSLETSVESSKDSDSDNSSTLFGNLFDLDNYDDTFSVAEHYRTVFLRSLVNQLVVSATDLDYSSGSDVQLGSEDLASAYSTSRETLPSLSSLPIEEHLLRIINSYSEHEDSDDFSEYEASDEFSENEDFDDLFEYDIFRNKCSLKADELPEESIAAWKTKFKQMKDMESILFNSPEDSCYVCYESLKEIISTGDLAVVPECNHILCLSCMEHCVTNSPNE